MMVAVALLAMTLASAAEHRNTLAVIAGCACATIALTGLLVFESTAHRDRIHRHEKPHLLSESYAPPPRWARRVRLRLLIGERGR
ncbi:hypothetical protein KO481_11145 [Nocardia sp. NEAU-G5]|uniref:Secreted protein n=1 Tax=Nocardia albiluteola TaxID=2842303 RepID=A0ABS6AW09_9NOCA|nr:hypothetical protein [Nocardia albiluteola]MBU3062078.1 hypothetical protein [Nocardia albiluteola]